MAQAFGKKSRLDLESMDEHSRGSCPKGSTLTSNAQDVVLRRALPLIQITALQRRHIRGTA
jgi:hypothetical protein